MTPEEIKNKISSIVTNVEIPEEETQYPMYIVPAASMRGLAESLKAEMGFDFLFNQTAIDYPDHMMVVYHLRNTSNELEICVKAKIDDRENAEVGTVSDIWRTAEFHEREVYDLFGIVFTNHPDLRRIFLTDDWKGWPLRKDYVDEINMIDR